MAHGSYLPLFGGYWWIVIPQSLRADMKRRIQSGHLGINSCLRRARDVVVWPGVSSEVRQYAECCTVCATFSDKQPLKTLECMKQVVDHGIKLVRIYSPYMADII